MFRNFCKKLYILIRFVFSEPKSDMERTESSAYPELPADVIRNNDNSSFFLGYLQKVGNKSLGWICHGPQKSFQNVIFNFLSFLPLWSILLSIFPSSFLFFVLTYFSDFSFFPSFSFSFDVPFFHFSVLSFFPSFLMTTQERDLKKPSPTPSPQLIWSMMFSWSYSLRYLK